MANENKDFANSVNKISDSINKANNIALDNANKVNEWYSKNINEMLKNEIISKRLETNIEDNIEEKVEEHYKKMLETYQIRHYGKTEEINPTIIANK